MNKFLTTSALTLLMVACQPEVISTYPKEAEEPVELSNADKMRLAFPGLEERLAAAQEERQRNPLPPQEESDGLKNFFGSVVRVAGKTAKFTGKVIMALGEVAQEQQAREQRYNTQGQTKGLNSGATGKGYLTNIEPVIGGARCYYSDGTVTNHRGSSNCSRRNTGSNRQSSSRNYLTNIEPVIGGARCYYSDGTVTNHRGSSNCPRNN